jgi:hypothetical protein
MTLDSNIVNKQFFNPQISRVKNLTLSADGDNSEDEKLNTTQEENMGGILMFLGVALGAYIIYNLFKK